MRVKKVPLRTCVVSKEKLPKQELLRVVKTPDLEIKIDLTGKLNGRGAYIKKDYQVLEKAMKYKCLERHLECEVPESIYEEIKELLNKEN